MSKKRSEKLLAFHGQQSIKDKYLTRVTAHERADEIVQGYGYWKDGKGCGVGCTIHGERHADYESELGIPERLAHLEDAIFEGLAPEQARTWPRQFLEAIPVGADLSLVCNRFAYWLLTGSGLLTVTDENREAVAGVAALHARAAAGEIVTDSEWSVAWSAAESAAESAARSAWSAWSAWSARSAAESAAESAVETAARSAWSAWSASQSAWSAWSAARSAAWSAVESAAVESARSAAWSAVESAARSAWSARSAAQSAAESAARSAAWSAARAKAFQVMSEKLLSLLEEAD